MMPFFGNVWNKEGMEKGRKALEGWNVKSNSNPLYPGRIAEMINHAAGFPLDRTDESYYTEFGNDTVAVQTYRSKKKKVRDKSDSQKKSSYTFSEIFSEIIFSKISKPSTAFGKDVSLPVEALCNDATLPGFTTELYPEKSTSTDDIKEYQDIFMLDPTDHNDMLAIATKFGVAPKWKAYLKTVEGSSKHTEIPDRYFNLLWFCRVKGNCTIDLNFIEGRHRFVMVLYFMCTASYETGHNTISPLSITVANFTPYKIGSKQKGMIMQYEISDALKSGNQKLVNEEVTLKIITADKKKMKKMKMSAEDFLKICTKLSEIISLKKQNSSKQSMGFKLCESILRIYDKMEKSMKHNEDNHLEKKFDNLNQPVANKRSNDLLQTPTKANTTSKKSTSSKKSSPKKTASVSCEDLSVHTDAWEWDEYNAYVEDPMNNDLMDALILKIEQVIGARPPFLTTYISELVCQPKPEDSDHQREANAYFVNVLIVLPAVYRIVKSEYDGSTQLHDKGKKNLKYMLKYGFQNQLPTKKPAQAEKNAYDFNTNLLTDGSFDLCATMFITYMIVSAMCHKDGNIVLDRALRHLEDQNSSYPPRSTIRNLGE